MKLRLDWYYCGAGEWKRKYLSPKLRWSQPDQKRRLRGVLLAQGMLMNWFFRITDAFSVGSRTSMDTRVQSQPCRSLLMGVTWQPTQTPTVTSPSGRYGTTCNTISELTHSDYFLCCYYWESDKYGQPNKQMFGRRNFVTCWDDIRHIEDSQSLK